jgi:hypothetical protein
VSFCHRLPPGNWISHRLLAVPPRSAARDRRASLCPAVLGPAAPLIYLAWLNRDGPGRVCETTIDGVLHCGDRYSPWPFVAIAAGLAVAFVVAVRKGRPARS